MDMDGLNVITVFVSMAFIVTGFIVTGFIALTSVTSMFNRAEGILFLASGIAVLLISYYRSYKRERNAS